MNVKEFQKFAHDSWESFYGRKPSWGREQYIILANVAAKLDDNAMARGVWSTYLRCTDSFFRGHTPNKFCSEIDRFITDWRAVGYDPWSPLSPEEEAKRAASFEKQRESDMEIFNRKMQELDRKIDDNSSLERDHGGRPWVGAKEAMERLRKILAGERNE